MNPAEFRHRITFQQREENPTDSEGFPISEEDAPYINVVTVWAKNKTVSGREFVQAAATQNERAVRWIIRYRRGLSENMRVLFEDRLFEIEAILADDELKRTLTVVCKEVI